MAVNLTNSPYYDEFNEDKNFQRILFKPGTALQSRELNEIQSILKNQIVNVGDGLYGDNSRITSEPSSFTIKDDVITVKIDGVGANLTSYIGKFITGTTSNLIGKVRFTFPLNDNEINDPAALVLSIEKPANNNEFQSSEVVRVYNNLDDAYLKNTNYIATENLVSNRIFTATGTAAAEDNEINFTSVSGELKIGDELVGLPTGFNSNRLYVSKILSPASIRISDGIYGAIGKDLTSGVTLNFYRKNTVPTIIVNVSKGIYYKKGNFIKVAEQSIVPDKNTKYPTKSIILTYNESIITYNDDNTLLDPAFESSNYLAPGADRLKIFLSVNSVDLTSNNLPDTLDDYVEVVRFNEGVPEFLESARDTLPIYLNNILAERTYEESGNYDIIPFRLKPAGSTSDDNYVKFDIQPGKAVIGGQLISLNNITSLLVPKAKEYNSISDVFLNANQDQYYVFDKPSFGFFNPEQVTLYDAMECHSTTDRTVMSNTTTLVGYVIPKHFIYDGGEGEDTRYRLYPGWYYQVSSVLDPTKIRSVISTNNYFSNLAGNNGTYNNPKFFANVNANINIKNNALFTLDNGNRIGLLFQTTKDYLKKISNVRMYYSKRFVDQAVTTSSAIITLSGNETFIGNEGTLSNSTKRKFYTLVTKTSSSGSFTAGQYMNTDSIIMTLSADKQTLTLNFSTNLVIGSFDLLVIVYNSEVGRRTKNLNVNYATEPITVSAADTSYSIFVSDIHALKGIYKIGSNNFARAYSSSGVYNTNDFVQKDDSIYRAKQNSSGVVLTNTSYWEKILPEPPQLYKFFTGQSDLLYDHGSFIYQGNIQTYNPGKVVLIVDYFTHTGTGFIDYESYPTNIQNNIPSFRSELTGAVYNLRNLIDFRPRKNDTNVITQVWGANNYIKPDPVLENALQIDYEYYLPRIDRLYLYNRNVTNDRKGYSFYLDQGISSNRPKAPSIKNNRDKNLIGTLIVSPYTKNSSDVNIIYNKSPRYRMNDISNIDTRLGNLEKRVKRQGLDIIALNNQVFSDGNQANLLYKTGILVDDFSSAVSNDLKNPHSTAIVNFATKELIAPVSSVKLNLFFNAQPDLNTQYDVVTMNVLSEEPLVSVTEATKAKDAAGQTSVTTLVPNNGDVKSTAIGLLSNPIVQTAAVVGVVLEGDMLAKGVVSIIGDGLGPIQLSGPPAVPIFDSALQAGGSVYYPDGTIISGYDGILSIDTAASIASLSSVAAAAASFEAATATSFFTGEVIGIGAAETAAAVEGISFVATAVEFLTTAAAAISCFTEDTLITMENGSKKKIKDVIIGDRVFNYNKTTINTVLYVEKDKDIKFEYLYSPDKVHRPFVTSNHPLFIDDKLSCPDPENNFSWYPWLGKNIQLDVKKKEFPTDQVVYNLWVDGDNTFIVNGYGTHSIIENVEDLVAEYHKNNITYEQVKSIQTKFSDDKNKIYGGILVLRYSKKLNISFVVKLLCYIHKDDSKPLLSKITFGLTKLLGKIAKLFVKG